MWKNHASSPWRQSNWCNQVYKMLIVYTFTCLYVSNGNGWMICKDCMRQLYQKIFTPWGRKFIPLLYVFPCVILFLSFSVLLVLRLPCLGKRELILVLFVRLFDLCLFRFVGFLFLLRSGKGCGLWLWHSLDFSITFFCPIFQREGINF